MFSTHLVPYNETNSFSKIILDYLDGSENLKTFYSFSPDENGIQEIIEQKKKQNVNRRLLVEELKKQYLPVNAGDLVKTNIELLNEENTFSICTAHQPNLFTGPLYFMYKILHTIKLAWSLKYVCSAAIFWVILASASANGEAYSIWRPYTKSFPNVFLYHFSGLKFMLNFL